MKNKIIASLLAVEMLFCTFAPFSAVFTADSNTINIKSKKDFVKFSQNCMLDSFSNGKEVNLLCDIDFSSSRFTPVAVFSGTFNGNGHTISGISLKEKGSYLGVFRYLEKSGEISNLKIEADILPGGSKNYIGGIAGENAGTVKDCSFSGNIKGENVTGGIAAYNKDSGQIISCKSKGTVIGENSTGGIAGKNAGFIQECLNSAAVNTEYEEKTRSVSDLDTDAGSIIENYKKLESENKDESLLGHTDTGGIAGYSSGIIQGCRNNAQIGLKHIGYNIGGIAGRQSGYILGCENHGFIQGRKDVGGIVGQAEPYTVLNASENSLKNLRSVLNALSSSVQNLIDDTDNLTNESKKYLDSVSDETKAALDSTRFLIERGTDFIDENTDEINAQAAILSNTLDKLTKVFDDAQKACDDLSASLEKISSFLDTLGKYAPDLSDDLKSISSALSKIGKSESYIRKAFARASDAKDDLKNAVVLQKSGDMKKALEEISQAADDILLAQKNIQSALGEITDIIIKNYDDFDKILDDMPQITANLNLIKENVSKTVSALGEVKKAIDGVVPKAQIDLSLF